MFEGPFFQPVLLTLNNIKKKFENFQRHWQVNPIPRGVDSSLLFDPCFFLLYFFYYCFVSTSGGPHQQEVSLLSSLFYSRKTGSWKMRDSMGFTNWIILRISAYNVCSNNMYFFLKKKHDCTTVVCLDELPSYFVTSI